jgi:hypothetical protein
MNLNESTTDVNGFGEAPATLRQRRTIPFDYAFRYDLEGVLDKVHNRTVTVSTEAGFTAVSIGYGVVPTVQAIRFGIAPKAVLEQPPVVATTARAVVPQIQTTTLGLIVAALSESLDEDLKAESQKIGPRTATVLRDGFKLNPEFADRILLSGMTGAFDRQILAETFQTVAAPPEQIQFLYAIVDEGTGREFQSEPILNIAGLGTANGMRPFRYFALPIQFDRRTTIRMQVTEKSEFQGELHVSLQGYKTLGEPGTPTGPRRLSRLRRARR